MGTAEAQPDLLLVSADTRAPVLAGGVALTTARGQAPTAVPLTERLWHDSRSPDDLAVQRWAVIAPRGPEGDELLARVAPLIDARAREQGTAVKLYRVRPGMTAIEAADWKRSVFLTSERHFQDLPRYQLILGDLHQVSYELQVSQAADGFVGRLAFDRPAHYAAYCAKLLAAEQAALPAPRAVFHAILDGTPATWAGSHGLVHPCVEHARDLRARDVGLFPAEPQETGTLHPTPDKLLSHMREPGVLLSLGHGLGAPRGGWTDPASQRALQGAPSFGAGGQLRGEDLAGAPCMPGGLWFMFACFGAGTPATSKYARWLDALVAHGHLPGRVDAIAACLPPPGAPPFVAAVPKTVLADPRGPLAFIGHIDLAWTYSFQERDLGRGLDRSGRFLAVLAAALRGDRMGPAFRELYRWFERVNTDLTALDESGVDEPVRRAQLWLLRQDLAGFVLLGDPAARVARAVDSNLARGTAPTAARAPAHDLAAELLGMTVLPAAATSARPDRDELERAIGRLLAGSDTLERAAAAIGVAPDELAALFSRYREAGRATLGR